MLVVAYRGKTRNSVENQQKCVAVESDASSNFRLTAMQNRRSTIPFAVSYVRCVCVCSLQYPVLETAIIDQLCNKQIRSAQFPIRCTRSLFGRIDRPRTYTPKDEIFINFSAVTEGFDAGSSPVSKVFILFTIRVFVRDHYCRDLGPHS